MLKKAGIVVAGAAVALLSVSPLAFAGGYDRDHHGSEQDRGNYTDIDFRDEDNTNNRAGGQASGLVALGEVNALNNVNICPPINAGVGLGNVLGILGTGTVAQDQDAVAGCVARSSEDQVIVDED